MDGRPRRPAVEVAAGLVEVAAVVLLPGFWLGHGVEVDRTSSDGVVDAVVMVLLSVVVVAVAYAAAYRAGLRESAHPRQRVRALLTACHALTGLLVVVVLLVALSTIAFLLVAEHGMA